MENSFNEKESFEFAAKYPDVLPELSLRVYTTRLLGGNSRLVLHGGGNTSVKLKLKNILGEENDVIFVKGTGWDMASIEPEGFTGLYLEPLRKLRGLDDLSSREMENQVKICRIFADAPAPSVEALLHAFIPRKYVEHTHSDSILIISNQKHGESMVKEAMGEKIAVLPYIASGFPLAKATAAAFDRNPDIDGIVIMNHGIFTFAEDVRESYKKMIAYINQAEAYIEQQIKGKTLLSPRKDLQVPANARSAMARCVQVIRGACAGCGIDGKQERLYTEIRNAPDIIEISLSEPAGEICRSGMLTPHHAILAKHAMAYIASVPQDDESLKAVINREIASFKSGYDRLFYESSEPENTDRKKKQSGNPSLFFIAGLGLVAAGATRKAAGMAADIGEHNIRAKIRAFALGEYQAVSDAHIFDIYRTLSKTKTVVSMPPLQGQVAVLVGCGVTGAGIAKSLLATGAATVICDSDKSFPEKAYFESAGAYHKDDIKILVSDVTDAEAAEKAVEEISLGFGGIDTLILNSEHAGSLLKSHEYKSFSALLRAAIPVFERQGTGGNIIAVGSEETLRRQISEIAEINPEALGIRVNSILIQEKENTADVRAVKKEILGEHIGNAAVFFAGGLTPTRHAIVPL